MNGDIELTLWLHEYKLEALTSALAEQGSTVEKRMDELLCDLYAEAVPENVRKDIQNRINAEFAAVKAKLEASRTYSALRVRENGADSFFQTGHRENLLDIGKFVRRFLQRESASGLEEVQKSFPGLTPISADQYRQMMEAHLENPKKVTGVFDLDFDRQEVSVIDAADGWMSYTMKDAASAVYLACRKSYLTAEQYEKRFANRLADRQIASAGHLSARDILLAEEISEVDTLLNFYIKTNFDVDAVFNTHVCTAENDDWLNVYANYDMETGQVCDELEVDLHRADGREESLEYRLNAAEKTVLFRKMDAYCQRQTGQTLAEYSAQRMAEKEMSPPTQPNM